MPIILSYFNENNLAVENNSKKVLAYTLNSKNNGIKGNDNILDEKDLLVDIFSLNEIETDSVRLNASTIRQLFDDTISLTMLEKKN